MGVGSKKDVVFKMAYAMATTATKKETTKAFVFDAIRIITMHFYKDPHPCELFAECLTTFPPCVGLFSECLEFQQRIATGVVDDIFRSYLQLLLEDSFESKDGFLFLRA